MHWRRDGSGRRVRADIAMIANYGFDDASGAYYISIDTEKCVHCGEKACLRACPADVLALETDDWDDEVAVVDERARNNIKALCAECKPLNDHPVVLPCQEACRAQAIQHSW